MLNYPNRIDARIAQAVAIVTFVVNYTILLEPSWDWIIYLLTADFILRYIHPQLSPTVQFFGIISSKLNLEKKYYFAPPKRFATLIGVILSSLISITTLLNLGLLQFILISAILVASFLQGFLDYCIGCQIYDWLIQLGIINDYQVYGSGT